MMERRQPQEKRQSYLSCFRYSTTYTVGMPKQQIQTKKPLEPTTNFQGIQKTSGCVPSHVSCVQHFATPRTVALQAPLMGFSRQEYWSWLRCPPLGVLSNPGTEPKSLNSPALAGGFFTTSITQEAHRRQGNIKFCQGNVISEVQTVEKEDHWFNFFNDNNKLQDNGERIYRLKKSLWSHNHWSQGRFYLDPNSNH